MKVENASPPLHPLRPSKVRIIVCEGRDDYDLLSGVLGYHSPSIYVTYANGNKNLSSLASILQPAIYIQDRDFDIKYVDYLKAKLSLSDRKMATFWPRRELENYLLYPDWIEVALIHLQQQPNLKSIATFTQLEIEQHIYNHTQSQVIYHAGNEVWQSLLLSFKQLWVDYNSPKSTELLELGQSEWASYLSDIVDHQAKLDIRLKSQWEAKSQNIIQEFNQKIAEYQLWATNLETIRFHFLGKEILQVCIANWQSALLEPLYGLNTLRSELTKQAIAYAKTIPIGQLRYDDRLGDIGLLAEKVSA